MYANNKLAQQQRFQTPVSDTLVRRAQQGDMNAHAELYQLFARAVLTLARGVCKSQVCAEDIVHNTFVKLINKIDTFEFRAPFGMWLRQIAVTESLMLLRKQKKHNWVSSDEFDVFERTNEFGGLGNRAPQLAENDASEVQSMKHQLSMVLKELPEHVRLILWLKEVEGYTHAEIAELVGKTPSYSKSLVARSYKMLREKVRLQQFSVEQINH